MPVRYVNGGTPNYRGQLIQDPNSFLDSLRVNLVEAGWTQESIGANFIIMRANSDNSHVGYFRFTIVSNPTTANQFTYNVQGLKITEQDENATLNIHNYSHRLDILASQDLTFTNVSRPYYNQVFLEGVSRYWLSCDQDSFVITIGNPDPKDWYPIWGGFLDRIDKTDPGAWGIGCLDVRTRCHELAKSAHAGVDWFPVGYAYPSFSIFSGVNTNPSNARFTDRFDVLNIVVGAAQSGLIDRFTCSSVGYGAVAPLYNGTSTSVNTNVLNWNFFYGSPNAYDGKVVLGKAFLNEGRANAQDYLVGVNDLASPLLYYRGDIKFVMTGMLSLSPGIQVVDCDNPGDRRYLAAGGLMKLGQQILGEL